MSRASHPQYFTAPRSDSPDPADHYPQEDEENNIQETDELRKPRGGFPSRIPSLVQRHRHASLLPTTRSDLKTSHFNGPRTPNGSNLSALMVKERAVSINLQAFDDCLANKEVQLQLSQKDHEKDEVAIQALKQVC